MKTIPTCDYHTDEAIESGEVEVHGRTYIRLTCPRCGRDRGLRLVRKARA